MSGRFAIKVITPPAAEPVTAADVKARLRVTVSDDDTDIGAMITAARELVEAEGGRALMPQTLSLFLDTFPHWDGVFNAPIRVPRPPLSSVSWIKYYDLDNAQQTLDPTAYWVASAGEPGRIAPVWSHIWPFSAFGRPEAVEVRYVAGYADVASVPAAAKEAIRLIVCDRYYHRGDGDSRPIPPEARRLIDTLEFGEIH